MSDAGTPGDERLPAADPGTGDLDAARQYIRGHREVYTPEALAEGLRGAGYPEPVIREAFAAELAARPVEPVVVRDLRARAAAIVIVGFLAVWAVLAIPLMVVPAQPYYFRQGAAGILTVILLVIGLLTLAVISDSKRLRNGAEGALAAILVIPFLLLFIVAGICVVTEQPWQAYP